MPNYWRLLGGLVHTNAPDATYHARPYDQRLRLNDLCQIDQVRPEPSYPYQQPPVTTAQPQTKRRPPQSDVELMTEKQVLSFEPAPRLEQVRDEHSDRMQDRKHRPK